MKRLLILMLCVSLLTPLKVNAIEGTTEIYVTAYTSGEGAVTASGTTPRYGICAGADKYLYDQDDKSNWVAMVWTTDGEFIGYFEIIDRGGTDAIRGTKNKNGDGTVIDIWEENLEECQKLMEQTNGRVLVKYVKSWG